jgi:hypothetical protein
MHSGADLPRFLQIRRIKSDLDALSTAVSEDKNQMGSTVKGWIEKTAPQVLSGGVKIAASVGQALLTEYLKHYFGLS